MNMFHLVLSQLQIICRKKSFQIPTFLLTAFALNHTMFYASRQQGFHVSSSFHSYSVNMIENDLFFILFPFIVIFPAGFSFFNDRKTKMDMTLISKMGKSEYYISKLIAGFVATFLCFSIPLLLELCLNCIAFPSEAGRTSRNSPIYIDGVTKNTDKYLFSSLFAINPHLYYIATVLLLGIFCGCVAVFIMGISTFRIPYKSLLFLPFYFFWIYFSNITSNFVSFETSLYHYMSLFDSTNKNIFYYVSVMLLLLTLGIGFTMWNQKHNI